MAMVSGPGLEGGVYGRLHIPPRVPPAAVMIFRRPLGRPTEIAHPQSGINLPQKPKEKLRKMSTGFPKAFP